MPRWSSASLLIMAYLAPGEYCFKNESFQGPHFLYYSGHIYLVSKLIQTMAFSFDLNVHPFTIVPYCFQDFSVLTNYEIGEAFCSALSIISYKLLETFLRHTLPIRNKPITVFALYDFSIKHQSSKLVTLHCCLLNVLSKDISINLETCKNIEY